MAAEVHWRGLVTGVTNYYTIRAARGTDINKYWDTTGTPALATLVTANWTNYKIALTESPASSYLYVGDWPATLTTQGWYYADVYRQSGASAAISDVLVGSFLGYWDGTSYKIAGSDVQEVRGTVQSEGDIVGILGTIGSGTGAAMNFAASSDNTGGAVHGATFVGAQAGGTTYLNTAAEDLVYHQLTNTANVIDIVYNFSVGAGRTATKAMFKGYIVSSNDTFDVQAWNYANSVWETRGAIVGQNTTVNITKDVSLLGRNTGTGSDAGDVHIRLKARAGSSSPSVFADEILVTASNIGQTVGYSNGSIWVSATGTSGTTPFVNGTGDNPCPWADALTLSTSLGIKRFEIAPSTQVTLSASAANSALSGKGWKLALGGQDLSYATITGSDLVTGIATSPTWEMFFWSCQMGACTLGEADLHTCHITDTITLGAAAPYLFHNCVGVPIGTPGIDFGAAVGASSVVCGNWTGPCTIANMKAGDVLIFDGTSSLTLDASCAGGSVYINGAVRLTNNGSGQTIVDTSRYGEDQNTTNVTGSVATVNALANDTVSAAALKLDAVTEIQSGLALEATLTAIKGAGWTDETLVAILAAIGSGGLTAQQVRDAMKLAPTTGTPAVGSVDYHLDAIQAQTDTILAGSITVTPGYSGGDAIIVRGSSWSATVPFTTSLVGRKRLQFALKRKPKDDLDAAAIIYGTEASGLLTVNGAAYTGSTSHLTMTVNAGVSIVVTLDDAVTALLSPTTGLTWAIQYETSTNDVVEISGNATVSADVIRTVT